MADQNDGRLTRRQFVKWSFGILAVSIGAKNRGFLRRLEELETWIHSDRGETEAAFLTTAQYLHSRPKLTGEFSIKGDINCGVLRSQDAELVLNDSAYFALSRCDGNTTVKELCEALSARFGTSPEEVQNDLVSFLNCLYRLDMMSFSITYRLDQQHEVKTSVSSTWATITT
ncbi:MAG: PqqD family protein [Anaerolineae bacterium]